MAASGTRGRQEEKRAREDGEAGQGRARGGKGGGVGQRKEEKAAEKRG